MNRFSVTTLGCLLAAASTLSASCSKPTAPSAAQPAAASSPAAAPSSSAPAAQPVTQPPAASTASSSGAAATEKHWLSLTNYSKTAVTVSLNGAWVGQWDSHANASLDQVVQGKNDLTVELADQPKNIVTVEIYAKRSGQDVNLLRLNFQDKPKGAYHYAFFAR